ncbi:MAG: hypothetical protein HZC54_09270 [Verrucomicrobia bacterium]|nr:hypothetical protein [Verrucomicrobiota bacterium]
MPGEGEGGQLRSLRVKQKGEMKRIYLAVLLVILYSRICPACILVEGFPGFDSLIHGSDAIWVVQIMDKVKLGGLIDAPDIFAVQVLRTLKGSIPDTKSQMTLIGLQYLPLVSEGDFTRGTRYLVFLKSYAKKETVNVGTEVLEVTHSNRRMEGTHWEVSKESKLEELSSLPVKQAIKLLLQDSIAMKKRKAALLEKAVKEALQKK